MAGLPLPSATVMVGPPFLARVPRSGVALRMSEACTGWAATGRPIAATLPPLKLAEESIFWASRLLGSVPLMWTSTRSR